MLHDALRPAQVRACRLSFLPNTNIVATPTLRHVALRHVALKQVALQHVASCRRCPQRRVPLGAAGSSPMGLSPGRGATRYPSLVVQGTHAPIFRLRRSEDGVTVPDALLIADRIRCARRGRGRRVCRPSREAGVQPAANRGFRHRYGSLRRAKRARLAFDVTIKQSSFSHKNSGLHVFKVFLSANVTSCFHFSAESDKGPAAAVQAHRATRYRW